MILVKLYFGGKLNNFGKYKISRHINTTLLLNQHAILSKQDNVCQKKFYRNDFLNLSQLTK